MKKLLVLAAVLGIMLTTGCQKASDLLKPEEIEAPPVLATQAPVKEPAVEEEPKTTIGITKILNMTNDWTIMGDFDYEITQKGKKDRIVLGTSAQAENGEMMWDDSQYWTLAVIAEDGAYNLFSERMQGYVYAEVNEGYINGITTTIITAYIFSGVDREIRNYIFDGEVFVEHQEYTTKNFSTGGINNLFTSMPEYKPW